MINKQIIVKNNLVIMTIEQYVKEHSDFRTNLMNEFIPVLEMYKNGLLEENLTDNDKQVVALCFNMIKEAFSSVFSSELEKIMNDKNVECLIKIQNMFDEAIKDIEYQK